MPIFMDGGRSMLAVSTALFLIVTPSILIIYVLYRWAVQAFRAGRRRVSERGVLAGRPGSGGNRRQTADEPGI